MDNIVLLALYLTQLTTLIMAAHSDDVMQPCVRTCQWPAESKVCNYHFNVEWFSSMATFCGDCPLNSTHCDNMNCIPLDGVQRPIITVNRMFPGPSIQVCEGDTINVTLTNQMADGEGLSIHWHGLHQFGTPFMDGVPKITQCPIPYSGSFTYTFAADVSGTHYWHAHEGLQRADGCFGSLIVRQAPQREPHSGSYDTDNNIVLLNDWFHQTTLVRFIGHHMAGLSNSPNSILINGHGQSRSFEAMDNNVGLPTYTQRELFTVQHQNVHRFRVLSNGITNCPLQISVDNHTLTVIASDGRPVSTMNVTAIVVFAGERFDFLLNANQEVGNYWLRVVGLGDCNGLQQLAIVRYGGAATENPSLPEHAMVQGAVLNPYNEKTQSETIIPIHKLVSLDPDSENILESTPDDITTYYLPLDFNAVNKYTATEGHMTSNTMHMSTDTKSHTHNKRNVVHGMAGNMTQDNDTTGGGGHGGGHAGGHAGTTSQINHVSFLSPEANILTQFKDIDPSTICSVTDVSHKCKTTYCECTQVLTAKLGEVIELVLVDEGYGSDQSHPMHIHGHAFRVLAQQRLGQNLSIEHIKELDKTGEIVRNLDAPPIKDTVAVPDGGFTIVRFKAYNPGWWLFHCHLQFHASNGMSMVIHVGEDEDVPQYPDNFPTCNAWPKQRQPEIDAAATNIQANAFPVFMVSTLFFLIFSSN